MVVLKHWAPEMQSVNTVCSCKFPWGEFDGRGALWRLHFFTKDNENYKFNVTLVLLQINHDRKFLSLNLTFFLEVIKYMASYLWPTVWFKLPVPSNVPQFPAMEVIALAVGSLQLGRSVVPPTLGEETIKCVCVGGGGRYAMHMSFVYLKGYNKINAWIFAGEAQVIQLAQFVIIWVAFKLLLQKWSIFILWEFQIILPSMGLDVYIFRFFFSYITLFL